ncbi:hypothetical protein ACXZ9C_10760 [Streptococcus agalactiae]
MTSKSHRVSVAWSFSVSSLVSVQRWWLVVGGRWSSLVVASLVS